MGNEHIVSVEKESKLSIDTGRLKITFVGKEPAFLALADIAVLILAHPCISVSLGVLQQLPLAGGVIITMDEKHLPAPYTLPVGINCEGGKRPHWQAKWFQTPESDAWWAQLLKSKIRGQATVAQNFDPVLAQKLNLLADAVVAGDKSAARRKPHRHTGRHFLILWAALFYSGKNRAPVMRPILPLIMLMRYCAGRWRAGCVRPGVA